jgi:tRNA-splicing ligase RtcB (3'-phosphate/5'-hydroxy nucleic acid ligase)
LSKPKPLHHLAGEGDGAALESACHGAGRSLSGGRAAHLDPALFERALAGLRVVGPIDPRASRASRRKDILVKYQKRMMGAAPAHTAAMPVVESVQFAGSADKVAKLFPHCAVKG